MADAVESEAWGYPASLQADQRPVRELIHVALTAEEDQARDAIGALHWRGTRDVLDQALALCSADQATHRACGADILGQLGLPERTFPDACFAALIALLPDRDSRVLSSAIMALQHLDRDRAMVYVLPFRHHDDKNVRYAVVHALASVERDEAIEALLKLMADRDPDVRNWATFGLGQQSEADSAKIREALAARLEDDDSDVRYEAICGLGRRGDGRAIPFLKTLLHEEPEDVFAREAAAKLVGLADDRGTQTADLLGALQRRQRWVRKGQP